jgi:hypothetical protein
MFRAAILFHPFENWTRLFPVKLDHFIQKKNVFMTLFIPKIALAIRPFKTRTNMSDFEMGL